MYLQILVKLPVTNFTESARGLFEAWQGNWTTPPPKCFDKGKDSWRKKIKLTAVNLSS